MCVCLCVCFVNVQILNFISSFFIIIDEFWNLRAMFKWCACWFFSFFQLVNRWQKDWNEIFPSELSCVICIAFMVQSNRLISSNTFRKKKLDFGLFFISRQGRTKNKRISRNIEWGNFLFYLILIPVRLSRCWFDVSFYLIHVDSIICCWKSIIIFSIHQFLWMLLIKGIYTLNLIAVSVTKREKQKINNINYLNRK